MDALRPAHCLGCGAASRPVGKPLALHGNGVRDRQVRGPPSFEGPSETVVVLVRRYECQACGASMTVVPREVLPCLQYSACAIGLALALYSLEGARLCEVRRRVCAWRTVGDDATGWPSLRRWLARATTLWPSVRAMPEAFGPRQRAERVASTLCAHAAGHEPLVFAAFVGAALAP